ncbi:MAG: low molecular weight protein-tyrosine-phosphatase, partial [Pseudomonadota bacterium]
DEPAIINDGAHRAGDLGRSVLDPAVMISILGEPTQNTMSEVGVLFVCLGNICRSPMAQGIFQRQVEEAGLKDSVLIDSCGTAAFNAGKHPDPRAIAAAEENGVDISQQIARQIDDDDYKRFDFIIAMDRNNLSNVIAWAPPNYKGEMKLLLDYTPRQTQGQVADPYYSEDGTFVAVFEEVERATACLLDHIIDIE